MTKLTAFSALALALFASVLFAAPAAAQASRTWVSSVPGLGDDANPCSRSAPCKTFAGAYSKTAAGGEIDALDPGGYGALTITKSLTIDGGAGQIASVLGASSAPAFIISGSGIVVTLRNITMDGVLAGNIGVNMLNAARVSIENCNIQGFTTYGVSFAPTVAGSKLTITNTLIHDNAGYGVVMMPVSSGLVGFLTMDNVKVFHNGIGMFVSDNVSATATNSSISQNTGMGVNMVTVSATTTLRLSGSSVSHNGGPGISLSQTGGHPIVRLSDSDILGNTGASLQIGVGTDVISYNTNRINDNGADNLPNGTAMLH